MGSCNMTTREHMTGFEIYVFVLCLIVFVLLTAMFSYFIGHMAKTEIQFIRFGHRDEVIKKEKENELNKNKNLSQVLLWSNRIFSLLLCLALIAVFIFAIYVNVTEDRAANGIPSIKIVKSESMAKKNSKNDYLFANNLNNQFQMFDVVICKHIPAEQELELYDIVVYKQEDIYIIHRIVGIEEPNEKHPGERHFLLQGDANERADQFPVLYSQMQGIYEGERIPFVGSFLLFLQSPAGWLCILLVVFGMIVAPIVEKIIENEKKKRLAILFPCESEEEPALTRLKVTFIKPTVQQLLLFKYSEHDSVCEIGTNVLERHYRDDDLVDLSTLKEKKLIKASSERLKITSLGKLNKRLTVYAHSCTRRAKNDIVNAGGELKLLPSQAQGLEGDNND